jgi:hypothetical protein
MPVVPGMATVPTAQMLPATAPCLSWSEIVSAGICQIGIHRDHVRLEFIHGAFLYEPRSLFEGTQKYKRYIRLKSYEDAPWDYLKQRIEEASQFDPRALQA